MISKRIVFWISLFISTYLVVALIMGPSNYCYYNSLCDKLFNSINLIGPDIALFPVIFFFSLVTYKMRDEVFKFWLKFCYFYIPIFVLIIFTFTLPGSNGGGWAIPGGFFTALIFFFLLFLFFLISLILVIVKYIFLHHKQTQIPSQNFPSNFQK